MSEKELNAYLKEVQALLVCDKKQEKAVMRDLEAGVSEYIGQRSNVTRDELVSVFGSPEEIAQSFIQSADTAALKRRFGIKKAVLFALAAIIVIYAVFVIVSLIDVHTEAHGHFEEGLLCVFGILTKGGAI